MPKLAQILQSSQAVRGRFVLIFFSLIHRTNVFHVAVGLFSNESQKTSKCDKNIDDTLACDSCSTFVFTDLISGAPNENLYQNHLNIALLNVF